MGKYVIDVSMEGTFENVIYSGWMYMAAYNRSKRTATECHLVTSPWNWKDFPSETRTGDYTIF